MRGMETITLAALLGLVAIGVWQGTKRFPGLFPHAGPAPVSAVDIKALEQLHAHSQALKGRPGNRRANERHFSNSVTELPGAIDSTVVVVPLPAPPNESNFRAGITRSQLREQFGDPALDVVARRDGRLIERFYYNADQGHFVVATLNDGRVVSAERIAR